MKASALSAAAASTAPREAYTDTHDRSYDRRDIYRAAQDAAAAAGDGMWGACGQ